MTQNREKRIKETLRNLLDLFREEGALLSDDTEEHLVRTFEWLRWDLRGQIPDDHFWEELDSRLRDLNRGQRRRFENVVREMLLQVMPARPTS
jgi:hypothetical protein